MPLGYFSLKSFASALSLSCSICICQWLIPLLDVDALTSERDSKAIDAPSFANLWAMLRPIPMEAPVYFPSVFQSFDGVNPLKAGNTDQDHSLAFERHFVRSTKNEDDGRYLYLAMIICWLIWSSLTFFFSL